MSDRFVLCSEISDCSYPFLFLPLMLEKPLYRVSLLDSSIVYVDNFSGDAITDSKRLNLISLANGIT